MKLSREKQVAAKTFIFDEGRPLERSLLACYFEKGSHDNVLAELAKFQNPEGGFGRALEPDFRIQDSSALATSIALQILQELRVAAENSLVREAIRYLLNIYDAEHSLWPIIPYHDNTSPHAPWWKYDVEKMARWNEQCANPGAQIIAHLYHYPDLAPMDFLKEYTQAIVSHLDTRPDAMEMHDIACYIFLTEAESLPDEIRGHIIEKVQRAVACVVTREASQWNSYSMKPLWVVTSPNSPFFSTISDEVQRNLDYEIERQETDGSWAPNWSWGGAFPEAWQNSEKEWRGVLTLKTLKTLRNFDRLE